MATISLRNINPVRFDYNVYMMSNVGIGTTSPATMLDLAQGGTITLRGNQNAIQFRDASDNLDFLVGQRSDIVADDFVFHSYGGDWIFNAGNVGIGTTSPGVPLDVRNSAGERVLRLVSKASNDCQMEMWSNNGASADSGWGFESANAGQFRITESTATLAGSSASTWTTRLVINEGGNVGIGTTSPSELLEVSSGGSTRVRIDSGDSGASSVDLYDNGSLGVRINCDSSKNLELMAGGRTGPDLIINTTTGNVGIGTTSPATELQIGDYTDAAETITIATSDNGTGRINFYDKNATEGGSIRVTGASNGSKMHFANRWNTDADKVTFDLINGRVGIGTASPTKKLEINAGDILLSNIGLNKYGLLFGEGANHTMGLRYDGTGTNGNLEIVDASNNPLVNFEYDGRVGIGTNSPAYKLDVNGTVRCNALVFADGTSFSSVGQVGMKAIAVNIGNGSSNIVARAQSIVNASYGGIQNGMVIVYYHWYYTYGCGNGTCGATAHRRDYYNVVNGNWTLQWTL